MRILFLPRFDNPFLRWGLRLVGGLALIVMAVFLFIAASVPWALMARFDPGTTGQAADRILFADVTVLPMTGEGLLPNRYVSVENGRITRIDETAPSDLSGFTIVEGGGRTLMPGLIDMHIHVFDRTDLLNYVTNGVTSVRNMMGMPMHLRWREEVRAGTLPGPRLITASPTLNQGEWAPFHRFVDSPAEAAERVRLYARRGYDLIKIYSGLQPDVFDAIIATANSEGVAVAGHQPDALSLTRFLQSGIVSLEHAEDVYNLPLERSGEPEDIARVVNLLRNHDVPLTPTLMAYRNLQLANADPDGFMASVDMERINPVVRFFGDRGTAWAIEAGDPERMARKIGIMTEVTRQLYDNRGDVILGTDTAPAYTVSGFSLHEEMALISAAGVNPYEILYSGTVAAASVLGLDAELGVVAEGALADLILIDGNPLEDLDVLRAPDMVLASSRLYSPNDLATLRERGTATMSTYATIGWLIWHELTK